MAWLTDTIGMVRKSAASSQVIGWALLVAGLLATIYAWQSRHPATTSDFTLFYVSAQQTTAQMFAHPPGPPRGNMNPPLFQLMLRPLTFLSLPAAAAVWRTLNVLALIICVWWLARTSDERWTLADYGVLLAWAPMASTITLNQLTWILWPLLLVTWTCWRRGQWVRGAVAFGLILSLKPFLGVFVLWLVVQRRWRAAVTAVGTAGVGYLVGIAVYGLDVTRAWIGALGDVTWAYAGMNASLLGMLTRSLTAPVRTSTPLAHAAVLVRPLALAGAVVILLLTLARTRTWRIDASWTPLMSSALLASPLGWLYYIWWALPGMRPSRLIVEAPLLLLPMTLPFTLAPSGWLTVTLGSAYFWGLLSLWLYRLDMPVGVGAHDSTDRRVTPAAFKGLQPLAGVATLLLVGVVVMTSAILAAQQSVADDPAAGTWVLDLARSRFDPPAAIESRLLTLTIVGDAVRQRTTTIYRDSTRPQDIMQFVGRYDGQEIAIANGFPPILTMRKRDQRTIELTAKIGDTIVESGTRVLSADHEVLTVRKHGFSASGEYQSVEVYRRQTDPTREQLVP